MCRSALPISLSAGAGPNRIICNRKWAKVSLGQRGWPKRDEASETRRIREWQKQVCLQRELTLLLLLQLHLLLLLYRPHKPQAALIRQAWVVARLVQRPPAPHCGGGNLLLQQWRPLTPFSRNVNEIKANYAYYSLTDSGHLNAPPSLHTES